MIRLIDILKATGIELGNYKIHFATKGKGEKTPLEAYFEHKFKEWQEEQNARNFECDNVIALIHRGADQWLFAGVYRILGVEGARPSVKYKTELLPEQQDTIGRIIVRYKRTFRNSYVLGDKFGSQLEVARILELPLSIENFKGFNKVRISHATLKLIVQNHEESWQTALSSVGGVYLVMDSITGKGYVGSAYGQGGIWQRWCSYAQTGHGNNVNLMALIEAKGSSYADTFQYAVLEIADLLDTDDQVLKREAHWKDVLMSREFGYN